MKKDFKNTWFLHFMKIAIIALAFLAINSSCKNDDEEPVEELPVFGSCKAVTANGRLTQLASDGIITYITSGGGKIVVDRHTLTISHKDYPQFKIEFWGESHENLNGKHIKDGESDRRSIIFPDGAKLTMIFNSSTDLLQSATIYDAQQCHHFNTSCNSPYNTLEYSSVNSAFTKQLDDAEADGETGTFEITQTGLLFNNIYNELTPGQKVEKLVPLGEVFKDQPTQTNDYYDDPRLGRT